jgi:uncharacterized membrane protein YhaH (DUF805 family)
MNLTSNLTSLLFSFRGRISRKQWWLGVLIIALAAALMLGIAVWSNVPLLAIPLIIAVFVATYALSVKRLHDRGKSGGWALIFIFLPGVLDRWSDRVTEESPLWWALVLIGTVLTIWGLIELGFRRGTDGDNEYGPDPLRKTSASLEAVPAQS